MFTQELELSCLELMPISKEYTEKQNFKNKQNENII